MIVKVAHPKREDSFKTLAKYIQRDLENAETHDNFASLSRYMARDEDFKAIATNCGCEAQDIDTAVQVVLATQNLNTRAQKKTMHLIVSFAAGERPTEAQLTLIEERLAASVGMQDLQRIRVVHDDTDHLHMHIAINRIHPESLLSIQPSRDYQSLSRCARELELELGLSRCHGRDANQLDMKLGELLQERKGTIHQHLNLANTWDDFHAGLEKLGIGIKRRRNGVVFVALDDRELEEEGISVAASSIDRAFSRGALEKRLGPMQEAQARTRDEAKEQERATISDAALRQERHRGTQSFQTWALDRKEDILSRIESASSWQEVHQALTGIDVELVPYRAGLSLVNRNGRGAIAASRIHRSLSRRSLEERLGTFESPTQELAGERPQNGHGYTEQPHVSPKGLYEQYLEDRDALRVQLDRDRERRKAARDRAFDEFSKKFADEAQSIRHNLLLNGFGKRLAYHRLAQRRKRSYERLKSRGNSSPIRRPPSYRQWLLHQAMTGNAAARDALRDMSARLDEPIAWKLGASGRVQGEPQRRRARQRPSAVFRDGAVEIERDGVPLIDDGERLHVTDNELSSVRALLMSAQERFEGPLEIHGNDEFMASVAICALEMPELRFVDQDLQQRVDLLRTRQRSDRESGLER